MFWLYGYLKSNALKTDNYCKFAISFKFGSQQKKKKYPHFAIYRGENQQMTHLTLLEL